MPARAIGLIVFAALAVGQPSAPRSPEAPAWPGDRGIPPELKNQYVFVSPERDALIIRVPPDSEYSRSGKTTLIRYELHNRIRPSVVAKMERYSNGKIKFEYAVTNLTTASDAIGTWWIVVPAAGEKPDAGSPDWGGVTTDLPIDRQVELPDQPVGRLTMWFQQEGADGIPPGKSRNGFHLESACSPGFTTALFGSGDWLSIDQDLPDEVFRQLDFYNDPTWGRASALTFGPMFCPGASRQAIAQNMISGIKRMIETHRLDPKSGFVNDALMQLHSQIAANSVEPASLNHAPSGEIETEIATALDLSLSLGLAAH